VEVRRRRAFLALGVLVASLFLGSAAYAWSNVRVPARATVPADAFMQSVATRDGRLGWQQLCPEAQAALPLSELVQQTDALRAADQATGYNVSMTFMKSLPRPEGGERRLYLATARRAGSSELIQRTFVVRTQSNGCVEGVE